MIIYFYAVSAEFGCFSNFSAHGFKLDGQYWPSSEHYFQAQKFAGTDYATTIRLAKSPAIAARLGRSRKQPLRRDWEAIKDDVMRRALLAKFRSHADIRAILLATDDQPLVENAPNDYYWGCGIDGSGKNMLGQLLVEIRQTLRDEDVA